MKFGDSLTLKQTLLNWSHLKEGQTISSSDLSVVDSKSLVTSFWRSVSRESRTTTLNSIKEVFAKALSLSENDKEDYELDTEIVAALKGVQNLLVTYSEDPNMVKDLKFFIEETRDKMFELLINKQKELPEEIENESNKYDFKAYLDSPLVRFNILTLNDMVRFQIDGTHVCTTCRHPNFTVSKLLPLLEALKNGTHLYQNDTLAWLVPDVFDVNNNRAFFISEFRDNKGYRQFYTDICVSFDIIQRVIQDILSQIIKQDKKFLSGSLSETKPGDIVGKNWILTKEPHQDKVAWEVHYNQTKYAYVFSFQADLPWPASKIYTYVKANNIPYDECGNTVIIQTNDKFLEDVTDIEQALNIQCLEFPI